jgi:hypothetical protein
MISTITLNAGATPGAKGLRVPTSGITVFVGPNNSGKSRVLVEIEHWLRNANPPQGVVLNSLEFEAWSSEDIKTVIDSMRVDPHPGEGVGPQGILIETLSAQNSSLSRFQINRAATEHEAQHPNKSRNNYVQLMGLFTLKLDGASRLALSQMKPAGDLQGPPQNHIAKLFLRNDLRARLRQCVFEAFDRYLVIDPTNGGHLRFRLSPAAPSDEREERGLDSTALAFHGRALPLEAASDGVRAFVGMLSTIIAADPRLILIDEPEAFLHPTLAARLGKEVTSVIAGTGKRIFVATHSAHFLMGCIQAGAPLNIVRLTYDYHRATARLMPREKLVPLMRKPLLRSAGVLNGLFHHSVVVTEADSDRSFYQEINERLLAGNDPRGISGCLFLNTQNKQTVWDVVRPLRELGIPAAGIVDIDVLKEGGAVWQKPLEGAFIPSFSHPGLQADRRTLLDAFAATGKDMKRDGGVDLLDKNGREACSAIFDQLAEYGVFVVERGELESWLPSLGVERNKATWLVNIFERMGEDSSDTTYVRPESGDVWDFIGKIKMWIANQSRKGIPD